MSRDLYPVWPDHQAEHAALAARLRFQGGDFVAWQQESRQALRTQLGLRPVDRPARIEPLWQRPHPEGVLRKLVLHLPGWGLVPMLWCVPHAPRRRPMPTMICLQGHSSGMHVSVGLEADETTEIPESAGDRDFARQCLRHGVAALCIEQRGFGQRRDTDQTVTDCQFMAQRALLLGRTLVAERVMDVQIALQWLRDQPEVDPQRIGLMGNSAGGTTTFFAAAVAEGLHLAVPSCSFGRLQDTWFSTRRCLCGYVPGLAGLMDLPDVLALHAPRPVVVVAGERDELCPGPAARAAFADLQVRYQAAQAPDACTLRVGPDGHRFYADLAWPAMLPWL